MHVCVYNLCRVWLCTPVDCIPPGYSGISSVRGISQAWLLEWGARFLRDLFEPGYLGLLAGGFFITSAASVDVETFPLDSAPR